MIGYSVTLYPKAPVTAGAFYCLGMPNSTLDERLLLGAIIIRSRSRGLRCCALRCRGALLLRSPVGIGTIAQICTPHPPKYQLLRLCAISWANRNL